MKKLVTTILAATTMLFGCGGGGGNPGECFGSAEVCGGVDVPSNPPPVADSALGLFKGASTNGRFTHAVVLPNNQLWLLYGQAGNATTLSGLAQGTYTASRGVIGADVDELSGEVQAVTGGAFVGTYVTRRSLAGSVSGSTQLQGITTSYDAGFETPATLAAIAGTFAGRATSVGTSEISSVTVTAAGALTGNTGAGCTYSGSVTASPNSIYSLTITFDGGACPNGTGTTTGIAFLEGTRLHVASINAQRNNIFLFSGAR